MRIALGGETDVVKILMLTRGLPYPLDTGAHIHDFHLLRELAREAEVVLCSLVRIDREVPEALRRMCKEVVVLRPNPRRAREIIGAAWRGWRAGRPLALSQPYFDELAVRMRATIERHRVDIVQIEHSVLAGYFAAIPADRSILKVLSFHNLGWIQAARDLELRREAGHRAFALFNALAMRGWEPRYAEHFDRCLVVSDSDASLLRAKNSRLRISVIENGVDCERLQFLPEAPENSAEILFVGLLGYPPNADAVLFFCEEILPLIRRSVPEATFAVVGREAPPAIRRLAARGQLTLVDGAPDPLPYYARARVSAVPLRAGSGTRLKILESMALGRAVVTTSIGCEGLAVNDGTHLMIADSPNDFAGRVVRVLREPALRTELIRNARELVEHRYDWKMIGDKLLKLYREMLAERAT